MYIDNKGFCLVWDNVGKTVKTRHHSTERQNKMMVWALSYAAGIYFNKL